jgi:hypothetical protein
MANLLTTPCAKTGQRHPRVATATDRAATCGRPRHHLRTGPRPTAQLQDSFPSLLFFSFFFFFFSTPSHVLQALPLAYKREGLVPSWLLEGGGGSGHTHSQVLKSPLSSREQSGLGARHTHTKDLGHVPLSIIYNPYRKPNTELVAQAAANWSRDILPESVYIFASSKLTIRI